MGGNRPRGRITLAKTTFQDYGMDEKNLEDVPAQGDGPPRARQSGNIVPVPAGSSSDDGLAVGSEESPTVALTIASAGEDVTCGRTFDPGVGGLPDGSDLQPVVRLARLDVGLGSSGTSGGSGTSSGRRTPICGSFEPQSGGDVTVAVSSAEKPVTVSDVVETVTVSGAAGTVSVFGSCESSAVSGMRARVPSAIVISDDESVANPSSKGAVGKVSLGRVEKPFRRRRGRPPTTGEWVGITEALERYNAARAVEMELDEVEYILDPRVLPKETKGKRDLPSIETLRKDLSDYSYEAIRKKAGESFNFIDKLSDKSSGISGKLIHELRVASRNLVASITELSDRAERQELEVLKRNRGNEYLIRDVERLRGELEIARVEIVSLRSSVSPSGRSPPHKKTKGLVDSETREVGTQMDLEEVSFGPISAPLPVSPAVGKVTVDRCCSPVWSNEESALPVIEGASRGGESGVSPSGSRDLTALEQSLLDHIEALFSQRNSLQEDIGRIRRGMEDPQKDPIPSVSNAGPNESRSATKARKRRSRKRGKGPSVGDLTGPPLPPPTGVGAAPPPCVEPLGVSPVLGDDQWSQVVGRKARRASRAMAALGGRPSALPGHGTAPGPVKGVRVERIAAPRPARVAPPSTGRLEGRGVRAPRIRPPTTAVVSVTIKPGSKLEYREIMSEARSKIDLRALGIVNSRIRQAINGGVLIQIPGKDRVKLADDLANKMEEVFEGKDVVIGRPSKLAELRVRGIDVSVTPVCVTSAIALAGGCDAKCVQVGQIRETAYGFGSVWVRCPALAARRVAAAGRVGLGWGFASVELLPPRPLVCYRCLLRGHTRSQCGSEIDRSDRCYRCGTPGHRANSCMSAPRCPLCTDLGGLADHVWGGSECCPASESVRAPGVRSSKRSSVPFARRIGSISSPINKRSGEEGAGALADNLIQLPLADFASTTGCLGAPAAGVAGTIVPGAPTSSSNEGLAGVLEAGIPVNSATVVEQVLEEDPSPKKDSYTGLALKTRSIDDILKDVYKGYKSVVPSAGEPRDSSGQEGDTFFGDSPPTEHHLKKNAEMEVDSEASGKKRKAEASLVVGSSSDEIIALSTSSRRRRRRNRMAVSSPSRVSVSDHIDLTAEYETPHGSDLTDAESVGGLGVSRRQASKTRGDGKVKSSTPRKGKKPAIFGSKIDFKPDLDSISSSQLLGMSATNAGLIGLECVEVVEAVRARSSNFQGSWSGRMRVKLNKINDVIRALTQKAESSGDPALLEARVRELSDELLATKKESGNERAELDKLKAENVTLRREIAGMRSELGRLDKIERENDDLWKVVKDLKAELSSLKKGGITVGGVGEHWTVRVLGGASLIRRWRFSCGVIGVSCGRIIPGYTGY
ncbi:gag-like protein [Lasius niger]|uniref:Gag-like protein n=1 Tax=Lasius niger TaxID=67767 RepID=A0A0J7KNC0_LASNI|nr:gag-like protein [Lasius niger]